MKIAEKRLRDYPNYDKEIRYRKWELQHKETDLNAGIKAQYKNTNPQEALVLLWENDTYIKNRLFWKKCVEETLAEFREHEQNIIKEYYFDDVYTYNDLGKVHHYSGSSIYRLCKKACMILKKKLGEG